MSDLLDRCIDAWWPEDEDRDGFAAVLRLIAAEILEHHHRASAREVAQMLLEAATTAPPPEDEDDDDEPPLSWADHPSLTVEQRNPTLR